MILELEDFNFSTKIVKIVGFLQIRSVIMICERYGFSLFSQLSNEILASHPDTPTGRLQLDETQVPFQKSARYLSVKLDHKLLFNVDVDGSEQKSLQLQSVSFRRACNCTSGISKQDRLVIVR